MKGGVVATLLAIAFSADTYLPDKVPPIFVGQAFAANANSDVKGRSGDDNGRNGDDNGRNGDNNGRSGGNNGRSGDNNGNGGQSANAPPHSGNATTRGGPALIRGIGRGLLRLLTAGGARSSSTGTSAAGVATGAPLQLLPPQAYGAATDTAPVGLPVPKPAERNLETGTFLPAAVATNDDVTPTYEDNLNAAVAVIEADSSFNATVDAYKALSAIIEAFEEAENRAQDE